MNTLSNTLLQTRDLSKDFLLGQTQVHALSRVNFQIQVGETVAVMGPSGGGKSTFLALLGGLDTPSSGQVLLQGQDFFALTEAQRVQARRGTLGYIFQGYALLPFLSVQDNVEYPLLVAGIGKEERSTRAILALEQVGLLEKADFLPEELSGGQQQRVGIARCVVSRPKVILADEPTGNLDSENTHSVLDLLERMCKQQGSALVIVTHDPEVAARADRIVYLQDGCMRKAGPEQETLEVLR